MATSKRAQMPVFHQPIAELQIIGFKAWHLSTIIFYNES